MKKPKKRNDVELNFWQPTSDMMSGLLYVLMLVIVLMGLALIQIPEFDEANPERDSLFASPTPVPTEDSGSYHQAGAGGAGGGATPSPTCPSRALTALLLTTLTCCSSHIQRLPNIHAFCLQCSLFYLFLTSEQ